MENVISMVKLNSLKQEREYKHLHKEKLCYCCDTLQESEKDIHIHKISNYDRGYGSNFDGSNIEIQMCSKCDKDEYEAYFNEMPRIKNNGYYEEYQYEEEIADLINSFIFENQEYVWNHEDGYTMDRQDWLDMKNNILPHEKYKHYNLYSPWEEKAYEERFPTCQHPVNVIYDDNSKGCYCPFGSSGNYNQGVDDNISSECYECKYHTNRTTPIKDIEDNDFVEYMEYLKMKIKEVELKAKFE